jgi:hypothetical protein
MHYAPRSDVPRSAEESMTEGSPRIGSRAAACRVDRHLRRVALDGTRRALAESRPVGSEP